MFKIIRSVGAPITKWFSRGSKAAVITKTMPTWRKGLSIVWKAVDWGLTGYALYDIFTDDATETYAEREKAKDYMFENFLPDEIKLLLSMSGYDTRAVSLAFINAGLQTSSEDLDARSIRSLSYLAVADYIVQVPSGTRYSPREIDDLMSKELYAVMTDGLNLPDEDKKNIKESLGSIKLEELPDISLRQLDFVVFMLENLVTLVEAEFVDNNEKPNVVRNINPQIIQF